MANHNNCQTRTERDLHGRLLVPPVARILRALVYGVTVFLSFFLMLIFMTYNVSVLICLTVKAGLTPHQAYYILAVIVGATLGHYIFGATMNTDAILNGQGDKG